MDSNNYSCFFENNFTPLWLLICNFMDRNWNNGENDSIMGKKKVNRSFFAEIAQKDEKIWGN